MQIIIEIETHTKSSFYLILNSFQQIFNVVCYNIFHKIHYFELLLQNKAINNSCKAILHLINAVPSFTISFKFQ